jgi:deleted-in-malignant-brain-tumors protein 1
MITSAGAAALFTGFTTGIGQIWLSDVQCDGNETRLTDCTIPAFGTTNCSHAEDAGVSCPACTQGAIRLRGGNITSGRVEICNNNIWGTVCGNFWGSFDAQVACRQLGFEATGVSTTYIVWVLVCRTIVKYRTVMLNFVFQVPLH